MARCKYLGCRVTIERRADVTTTGMLGITGQTDETEWVDVDQDNPDRHSCPGGGSDGYHLPLVSVTVERHPGDSNGDVPWCDIERTGFVDHFAEYLVDGDIDCCADCVGIAVDRALRNRALRTDS